MSSIAATFSAMVNVKRKDGTRYNYPLPPSFRHAICVAITMCLFVTIVCSCVKDCQPLTHSELENQVLTILQHTMTALSVPLCGWPKPSSILPSIPMTANITPLTNRLQLHSCWPQACCLLCRARSIIKGIPVLDRIGNVLKHIILLLDDRGGDRAQGAGDAEGSAVHREDIDGELVKAFMTTDASVPDVPIVDTSPGFQVACRHSICLHAYNRCIQHHACKHML